MIKACRNSEPHGRSYNDFVKRENLKGVIKVIKDKMDNIPFHIDATSSLSIHMLVVTQVVSTS